MTKKHYIAIAAVLREQLRAAGADSTEESAVEKVAQALAAHFEAENRRFNKARFLAACGVEA